MVHLDPGPEPSHKLEGQLLYRVRVTVRVKVRVRIRVRVRVRIRVTYNKLGH